MTKWLSVVIRLQIFIYCCFATSRGIRFKEQLGLFAGETRKGLLYAIPLAQHLIPDSPEPLLPTTFSFPLKGTAENQYVSTRNELTFVAAQTKHVLTNIEQNRVQLFRIRTHPLLGEISIA